MPAGISDILPGNKIPIIWWRIITAQGYVYGNLRSQRRPSIIFSASPPAYPCRCPFVSGNPHPAVAIFIKPSSIMKWCPSPTVVGRPGPSGIRINPVSIGRIGSEVWPRTGHPYIAVSRVINPASIGRQLVVKRLIRNILHGRRGRLLDHHIGWSAGCDQQAD